MDRKKEISGHIFAIITIIIWGMTFISTKILLKSFTPIEILFLRFVIGFIALSLVCPHRLIIKDSKHELYFAAAGLCGVTLYYLLENMALTYTLASNVGVIISIAPFFTAIFAKVFLNGEKLKVQFFVGFIIALAGIYFISFNGQNVLKLNPLGDVLAALAAVVWAAYSVLAKKISGFNYNTVQTTRRIFFYGLVFIIPALFIFKFNLNTKPLVQPINIFNILFLGLGASALCFVTWNSAVKTLGAVKTSVYIYLVPVITLVTSVVVLQEKITGFTLLGIVLTLAGLFISENRVSVKTKGELQNE
ncbi:MAG: DMT family transporter [Candidatus Metalachnospira sp.]|nr:DMT family transporter [Candidatus Metalachnospira sp.]